MIITNRYEAQVDEVLPGTLVEIETRGLRPERHPVTVGSVAEVKGNTLHTTQWIAGTKEDEPALLALILPVLADKKLTVFHGRFLVPFLAARAEKTGLVFAPGPVTDIRKRLLALKPFYPFAGGSRTAMAEQLGLPLPLEPNGEDVARLTRRLYKRYDPALADRIAAHNLLHIRALYGMAVFAARWRRYLQRTHPFFPAPVRLHDVRQKGDFITAEFITQNAPQAYFSGQSIDLSTRPGRIFLRIESKEGMITETMPCLFTGISDFPALTDQTGFHVPNGAFLLRVEDRFLPESLFSLLEAVIQRLSGSHAGFSEIGNENEKQ